MNQPCRIAVDCWKGKDIRQFVAEYNAFVNNTPMYIEDAIQPRRYLATLDTMYTADIAEAIQIQRWHSTFVGAATIKLSDDSLHAVLVKDANDHTLVCEDLSNDRDLTISKVEFIGYAMVMVDFKEVQGLDGERLGLPMRHPGLPMRLSEVDLLL